MFFDLFWQPPLSRSERSERYSEAIKRINSLRDKQFSNFYKEFDETFFGLIEPKNENGVLSLSVDLPGLKKDSIQLYEEDGYLYLNAKTKKNVDVSSKWYFGEFDKSTIDAKYEDGVLYINAKQVQQQKQVKNNIVVK